MRYGSCSCTTSVALPSVALHEPLDLFRCRRAAGGGRLSAAPCTVAAPDGDAGATRGSHRHEISVNDTASALVTVAHATSRGCSVEGAGRLGPRGTAATQDTPQRG